MKSYANRYVAERTALYLRIMKMIERDYKAGKITLKQRIEAEYAVNQS